MSTSDFWDDVLEQGETLLWAGRPKPRFHWRNWRLFGPAPMAAAGLLFAAWFIILTKGSDGDMWLLILPALLVLIPARATWHQIKAYRATRYALTNQRVLFFQVSGSETRVKAYPASAMIPTKRNPTMPPSVSFLRVGEGKKREIGFDYIETADDLMPHLRGSE